MSVLLSAHAALNRACSSGGKSIVRRAGLILGTAAPSPASGNPIVDALPVGERECRFHAQISFRIRLISMEASPYGCISMTVVPPVSASA